MKHLLPEEPEENLIQMGPLIDCVFLLLIFFMVVALTKKSQWVLPLFQAQAAIEAPADIDAGPPVPFEIRVDRQGRLSADGAPLAGDALATRLRTWREENPDQTLWIRPHQDATLGQVAPAFEAARVAQVGKVRIWTEVRPR